MTEQEALAKAIEELDSETRYKTILIDPPWPISKFIPEGASTDLRPSRHSTNLDYPTMPLSEIRKLPIHDILDYNGHVYLWATQRFLPEAFEMLKVWGLHYHCCFAWVKHQGICPMSFCFNVEFMLFAYSGRFDLQKRGLKLNFTERPHGHSAKPEESYRLIEEASWPKYLEMFARSERNGWDSWGNQVRGDIKL